MRRSIAALCVFLMAACTPSGAPTAPLSAAEAECNREADSNPAVVAELGKAAGNLDYQWQHGDDMRQVKRDAVTACLRGRGLASRGGVERPQ